MRSATLTRAKLGTPDEQGTRGRWRSDSGFACDTLELPDRGNAPDLSCIPEGTYLCRWMWSEKHGRNLYHLLNVPGRTVVEIHAFNLAGDRAMGYVAQSLGCIAPGLVVATFPPGVPPAGSLPQVGVANSGAALAKLEEDMWDQGTQVDFQLTIIRAK